MHVNELIVCINELIVCVNELIVSLCVGVSVFDFHRLCLWPQNSKATLYINNVIEQLDLPEFALSVKNIMEFLIFHFHRYCGAFGGSMPNTRHTRQRHIRDAIRSKWAVCDNADVVASFPQYQIANAAQCVAPSNAEQNQA